MIANRKTAKMKLSMIWSSLLIIYIFEWSSFMIQLSSGQVQPLSAEELNLIKKRLIALGILTRLTPSLKPKFLLPVPFPIPMLIKKVPVSVPTSQQVIVSPKKIIGSLASGSVPIPFFVPKFIS